MLICHLILCNCLKSIGLKIMMIYISLKILTLQRFWHINSNNLFRFEFFFDFIIASYPWQY